MQGDYTALIQKGERFWIGWIKQVPGVNSQGETREEPMANLQSVLAEMLALNAEAEDGSSPSSVTSVQPP